MRSKNMDQLSNCGYNLTNGQARQSVQVPEHGKYNPPGSSGSTLGAAGAAVFGGGFAGRPIRGMDKDFGKRVVTSNMMQPGGSPSMGPPRPPLGPQ